MIEDTTGTELYVKEAGEVKYEQFNKDSKSSYV